MPQLSRGEDASPNARHPPAVLVNVKVADVADVTAMTAAFVSGGQSLVLKGQIVSCSSAAKCCQSTKYEATRHCRHGHHTCLTCHLPVTCSLIRANAAGVFHLLASREKLRMRGSCLPHGPGFLFMLEFRAPVGQMVKDLPSPKGNP